MFFHSYPYHVYMVRCNDGSLYTGITNNIERRLRQHNGELCGGARYTRGKGPVQLVYIEKCATRSEASKREWHIKHTMSHQDKEMLITNASKEQISAAI